MHKGQIVKVNFDTKLDRIFISARVGYLESMKKTIGKEMVIEDIRQNEQLYFLSCKENRAICYWMPFRYVFEVL